LAHEAPQEAPQDGRRGLPVEVRGLTRQWGRAVALRRIDLSFPAGSCTLVLGGNGSGKSTLMSVLSGRLAPTRGSVHYGDVEWRDADEEVRGRIGIVGHGAMLYRDLTGRENLRFQARLHGLPRAEVAARVEAALADVDMAAAADRPVGKCSQGMVRRLSLARALLHRPGLLLLDEPFAGLDRAASARLVATLRREKQGGATLVVVTHAPAELAGICDRVAVLSAGRLAVAGAFEGDAAALDALLVEPPPPQSWHPPPPDAR